MVFVLLVAGLGLLILAGTLLVDGAANLATRLHVPPVVLGLTLVAFGTSLPELAVNISASRSGNTALSLGNIFGSNIANLGLVLGAALLIRSLSVESAVMRREIPLLLLTSAVAVVLASDGWLRGTALQIDRADSFILLLLFLIFVYVNLSDILTQRNDDPLLVQAAEMPARVRGSRDYLYIGLGIIGLPLGASLVVNNATAIATQFGVSQAVIGLSLVAIGTSVPELVTSVIAAVRNQGALAVGNVVGSNLINMLLILPISAQLAVLPIDSGAALDIWVSLLFTVALCVLALLTKLRLNRLHGLILLVAYFGYIGWRFSTAIA
jgi:cation:H+ antiporter